MISHKLAYWQELIYRELDELWEKYNVTH